MAINMQSQTPRAARSLSFMGTGPDVDDGLVIFDI